MHIKALHLPDCKVVLLRIVFLVSRDCCVALPRGAMGLSVICDCGIPDNTHYFFTYITETCCYMTKLVCRHNLTIIAKISITRFSILLHIVLPLFMQIQLFSRARHIFTYTYVSILCLQVSMVLGRRIECTNSPETFLVAYAITTNITYACFLLFQDFC